MVKKDTLKKVALPVPTSLAEAADFLRRLGEHQRHIARIQTEVTGEIETIKAHATEATLPHQEAIQQLFDAIYAYGQSHRQELTEDGKKKTVSLPSGEIFWRRNPPSVSIRNVEQVVAACEKMGLGRFIRLKKEPDKEAMLKEPNVAGNIQGVAIKQDEEFGVKPSETQVEVARTAKSPKKK